ncbi:triokinase/FMN cyclase-like isoform X2 [Bacillus rossius redtenbacheri]|uniref:triokinase/FMN cyclase-like isoform X2 n=1 Tax=Bacillus rossius redtenbacheri TaxID=93214 RepID=UPI002FDDCCFB
MHTAVDDALAGLVMTNPGVMLLEAERAVMRRDHRQLRGRVMLVSGGASGHEPYPAGYVGSGMLTAAVVGDVSAAPPPLVVVKVVRGLLENHPEGVLLVVGYRPGDRLSFTVAAEILSSEGLPVRLVLVDGMTGAVLIFKLAGAMAEKGASLEELFTMCSRAVADLISIDDIPELSSVLHHCKCVPDIQNEVIDEGEGINCERASVVITPEVVQTVQKQFGISSPPFQDLLVTLLVNNMGQAHKLHEQAFAMKTTKQFLSHGYKVKRLYCGSFATSFKGKGFSVSVLKMCGDLTELLDAPTSAPAWPRTPCPACWEAGVASDQLASPGRGVVDASEGSRVAEVANSRVLQIVLCTVQAVVACREQLDMLDSGEGDGDCGTTLGRGAQAVMKAISDGQLNCESPSALLSGLSCVCGRTMGGVSGALYYVLFSAAAQVRYCNCSLLLAQNLWSWGSVLAGRSTAGLQR